MIYRSKKFRLLTDSAQAALMMLNGDRTYSFDANAVLSDGSAPYTSTGYAQANGIDGIMDLGGNQGIVVTLPSIADSTSYTPQQPRIDAYLVIDLTAITATGSALAKLVLEGSNDPAFGSGVQILGAMQFGNSSVLDSLNGITTPAPNAVGGSRYELGFTNEQNNIKYQYLKIRNVISGAGSITYKAFVAVTPEP